MLTFGKAAANAAFRGGNLHDNRATLSPIVASDVICDWQ